MFRHKYLIIIINKIDNFFYNKTKNTNTYNKLFKTRLIYN
uniref:Uncharacterized protein n=1 Tax=viral metagenome TaxID=1070528 RepID=A0A6C0AQA8_9ZZZZ